MRTLAACLALTLVCSLPVAASPEQTGPTLRLLPLREGVRDVLNRLGDTAALKKTEEYQRARAVGLDLADLKGTPVVAHGMRQGRLFYLFYKKLEHAYGARQWVVQRIKRTERNWADPSAEPETKVTFQVEAFKLFGGEQKRGDQHKGGYTIRTFARREIVKEYEVGFADVPGVAEGDAWPWKKSTLFEYLVRYGPRREIYDKVRFESPLRWSLRVRLDDKDDYQVLSPELGIELPQRDVDPARTVPKPLAGGKALELERGVGLAAASSDVPWFDGYQKLAGQILQTVNVGRGATNVVFAAGLLANRRADGTLNTLQTRSGFAGRTKAGVSLGARRWEVLKAYGQPRDAKVSAAWWHYGDIGFWFDGLDRVGRIYVRRTNK